MASYGVLLPLLIAVLSSSVECHKCERIAVPMCKELGYNLTVMPNLVGHEDQQQAERAVSFLKHFFKLSLSCIT
jgi:hypothetical protein